MGYYDAGRDVLYYESEFARDIIELVDVIRNSAYEIKIKPNNPFKIRGIEMKLHDPKSKYTFFEELWQKSQEIPSNTHEGERGLRISDLHVAAIIYGLRQDFFKDVDPGDSSGSTIVAGWYIDPVETYVNCLPDMFEDFQTVFEENGALALQGRGSPILGYLSSSVAKYVQREFAKRGRQYKKRVSFPPLNSSQTPPI